MGLKVRPYLDIVLQCFGCYRYGHLLKHCRRAPVCITCREFFRGHYGREWKCVNCGCRHKPTDRRCEALKYNQEIKRVMAAASSISVFEAKNRLA